MLQAMNFYYLLPIALGVSVLIQGSLNKDMALQYGLSATLLFNAIVVLILSALIYAWTLLSPSTFPDFFQNKSSLPSFPWIYVIPGMAGFFIVLGLPWSLAKLNPSNTIVLFIATQIVLSLALEAFQSKSLPATLKLLGAILVLIGSFFVVKS